LANAPAFEERLLAECERWRRLQIELLETLADALLAFIVSHPTGDQETSQLLSALRDTPGSTLLPWPGSDDELAAIDRHALAALSTLAMQR
jgi:hypothetical protein